MNRDEVIRMAREAGLQEVVEKTDHHTIVKMMDVPALERFAALVAAAEREACAKAAETHLLHELANTDDWPDAIAAAIRERGQQ